MLVNEWDLLYWKPTVGPWLVRKDASNPTYWVLRTVSDCASIFPRKLTNVSLQRKPAVPQSSHLHTLSLFSLAPPLIFLRSVVPVNKYSLCSLSTYYAPSTALIAWEENSLLPSTFQGKEGTKRMICTFFWVIMKRGKKHAIPKPGFWYQWQIDLASSTREIVPGMFQKKCMVDHGGTLPGRDGLYHPYTLEFSVPERKMYI